MRKALFSSLLISLFLFIQCTGVKDDCKNAICTDVFVSVGIILQYPDQTPVILDSFKVYWQSKDIYLQNYPSLIENGYYPIVTDLMVSELYNKETNLHFIGYLRDQIIFEREVLVGADCCYVQYLGQESLTHVIEKDISTSE